jgi:hypothetical protein
MWADVEIEDIHRKTNRSACVRNIHDTRNMALDRRTRQQKIDLVIIVPWRIVSIPLRQNKALSKMREHTKPPQILNNPQTRLTIRHRRIQVMLFARLVHAEPFEVNVSTRPELGLHGTGDVDGGFHAELRHAILHDGELECNDAGHFDGAAETDFAVALREVQIADAEFCARDVHRQKDFGAAREVFDIAISLDSISKRL